MTTTIKTKTTARDHQAPALMAREDDAADVMAIGAVVVAATALEDLNEICAALMMDPAGALAAITAAHTHITTDLMATTVPITMVGQDGADPGAVAVVAEVAVLSETPSAPPAGPTSSTGSTETLHQCLHPCGRLLLPSTRPNKTTTSLPGITRTSPLKPTSSTLPLHILFTSPYPAQRRKTSA